MARIIAIDYGKKRTGIAVSDPLQIIARPLETLDTPQVIYFLKQYTRSEPVEKVLIGYPLNWDQSDTHATPLVRKFIANFQKVFPDIPIEPIDEQFTSKMASQAIKEMGLKKKARQQKALVDVTSAVLILQEYLQNRP